MIVPTSRLIFWFTVIVLPFSALGAMYAGAGVPALALIASLAIVALVDAALATGRLNGLGVTLPPLVRFSKGRPGTIDIGLQHPAQAALRIRLGLALPHSLASGVAEQQVELPAGAEFSRVAWPCSARERGRFHVRQARVETLSRLGFWAVRRSIPVSCELRVYPHLLAERKTLAALFLNRGTFGVHAQRMVGKGRDFEKLREYIPGDSYDEIHWKATAKRGHPVTKIFQIERTQEIYVILDASRLSARPVPDVNAVLPAIPPGGLVEESRNGSDQEPGQTTTLERFITSGLVLAQAAEKQGDLFGLLTFTDSAHTFLRARNGQQHYAACRDALYTLEPRNVTPDFDEIVSFIRTRLRRRALLMFLTSLDDPVLAESFLRNMALLAGQHLVLVNMIQPTGVHPLFSNPAVADLDDIYRQLGGHMRWVRLQEMQKALRYRGVRFSLVKNEGLATDLVAQYVGVKQRQLI